MLSCALLIRSSGIAAARTLPSAATISMPKRFAGGGGRPGGRPTFNWKQKQQLRLLEKAGKRANLAPVGVMGDFQDIRDLVDAASTVDITNLATYESPRDAAAAEAGPYEGDNNTRKQILVANLYGSHKPCGPLVKKQNFEQRRFSHRRLFEDKKAREVQA